MGGQIYTRAALRVHLDYPHTVAWIGLEETTTHIRWAGAYSPTAHVVPRKQRAKVFGKILAP